jgi:hypothetical protein
MSLYSMKTVEVFIESDNGMTFGSALAFVSCEGMSDDSVLTQSEKDYLKTLRERYIQLDDRKRIEKIYKNIPRNRCVSQKCFLDDNIDFFISYVLLSEKHYSSDRKFSSLFKHLNDCYGCFEVYTEVIRNYYYTLNDLLEKGKGDGDV